MVISFKNILRNYACCCCIIMDKRNTLFKLINFKLFSSHPTNFYITIHLVYTHTYLNFIRNYIDQDYFGQVLIDMPARILDDPIPPADFPMELLDELELVPPVVERRTCDLVISGVSCRLPESENMEEFEQHLMNGEDMVTEDDRRWQPGK